MSSEELKVGESVLYQYWFSVIVQSTSYVQPYTQAGKFYCLRVVLQIKAPQDNMKARLFQDTIFKSSNYIVDIISATGIGSDKVDP